MSAKAFYLLYFDLELGRDAFPLKTCIAKIGIYFNTLPSEINLMIWNYYHQPLLNTQRNTILSLLETLREEKTYLFRYHIRHMLQSLRCELSLDRLSTYAESIWNSFQKKSLRGTPMTVGLFTFLKQRCVVISMFKWKMIGAELLIDDDTNDFLVMKTALLSNPQLLSKASFRIRNNDTLLLDSITDRYEPSIFFRHMSQRLRNNKDFILALFTRHPRNHYHPYNMSHISTRLKDDEDIMRKAVMANGYYYLHASERLQRSKEIALLAVKEDGNVLPFIDETLRRDRDIVTCAIISQGFAMKYVGAELQNDRDLVELDISNGGWGFEYVHERFKEDEKIIRKLVTCKGSFLEHASERFRDNLYIVVTAMDAYIANFFYASHRLRDNHAVALHAVMSDREGDCFGFVSQRLKDNEDIVMAAVTNFGRNLRHVSERLKDNRDIVKAALASSNAGNVLEYASSRLRDDKGIVRIAIETSGENLRYASERFRDDKELVLAAFNVKCNCDLHSHTTLHSVSKRLQSDTDVMRAAITQCGKHLEFADDKFKDDEELVTIAVTGTDDCIRYASERIKSNKSIVMRSKGKYLLNDVDRSFRDDKEVVMKAVAQGGDSQLVSRRLQQDEDVILTIRFS